MSQNRRKRIVLKVWQKDGQVYDTAGHLEWLERQGWTVVCAEPLLDAPGAGVDYVSYLLEWPDGKQVPPDSIGTEIKAPVPDHKLVPNKISVVQTPAGTKFINLFAHITRGTMIVRNLNDAAIEPWLTLRTTLEKGPENGITRFEDDGAKKRHIAITCMHDQEPPPSDAAALPDSAPAFMTLDAYYGGGTTAVQRLFQFAVRPGDVGTFYVHFDFK